MLQGGAVVSFCSSLFLTLFFHCTFFLLISAAPLLVRVLHGLQSLRGRTCFNVGHLKSAIPSEVLPALAWRAPYCSSLVLPTSQHLLPFLEYVFTEVKQNPLPRLEVSQIWPMGPACGGSVAEWLEMAVSRTGQSLISSH